MSPWILAGLVVAAGIAALVWQVWRAPLREIDDSDQFENASHVDVHDVDCGCDRRLRLVPYAAGQKGAS